MKDFYTESYKILLRKVKKPNKWRFISLFRLEDILFKMQNFPHYYIDSLQSQRKSQWVVCVLFGKLI